jgi:periplasmic protein CpxP/Spy
MKHALKHLVAAGLLASLGLAATAQTPPPAPAGAPGAPHHQRDGKGRFDPAKMQERMAKRQAELKQKLALTPAQEPAWTSFTNAMRPSAPPARPDREAIAKLPTPERIDHLRTVRNQRIAEMDRRGEATKAFYAQLTPEQKKVFDENAFKRGRHGHGGHHGPRHG